MIIIRYFSRTAFKQKFPKYSAMEGAYFLHKEGEENVDLKFHVTQNERHINKTFNFKRSYNEPISRTIERIRTNYEKVSEKRSKGKKKNVKNEASTPPPETDFTAGLLNDGKPISNDLTWEHVFGESNINPDDLVLQVCDQQYKVKFNYPQIESIELPLTIITGFKCYPSKCSLLFTTIEECKFEWFKSKSLNATGWEKCGDELIYHVKDSDVDHNIKVEILSTF